MSVQGVEAVISALKKHERKTLKGLRKGLFKGGSFLQRKSMELVPIDLNVLRPSARTRHVPSPPLRPEVVVAYRTDYAVYVHEDLEARHKPGKTAKYLERPLRQYRRKILSIVMDTTRNQR